MNTETLATDPNQKRLLTASAWLVILIVSDLPAVILSVVFDKVPGWVFLSKIVFLVLFCAVCSAPLLPYGLILLVFFTAMLIVPTWLSAPGWLVSLISDTQPFALARIGPYVGYAGITFVVIATLWALKRRRREFFLVRGELDAPIGPVRWLGIGQGESWRKFGWIFAVAAALIAPAPVVLAIRPSVDALLRVIPQLPAILLFAAANAFNEEVWFRATLLSTLPKVIGKNATLGISAVFFGLAHYLHGMPSGMVGFVLTGSFGWIAGKSMLETKGLFWAWFMHFLADIVIFIAFAAT